MIHPTEQLLDYVYGELGQAEASALEAHLSGCPDCARELEGMRGVRRTFAQLAPEPAPSAGLESLLAYAAQSAERAKTPEVKPRRFSSWLAPLGGLLALGLVVVIADRSQRMEAAPAAGAIAPTRKEEAKTAAQFGSNVADLAPAPAASPPPLAQAEAKAALESDRALAMREVGKPAEKKKAEPEAYAPTRAHRAKRSHEALAGIGSVSGPGRGAGSAGMGVQGAARSVGSNGEIATLLKGSAGSVDEVRADKPAQVVAMAPKPARAAKARIAAEPAMEESDEVEGVVGGVAGGVSGGGVGGELVAGAPAGDARPAEKAAKRDAAKDELAMAETRRAQERAQPATSSAPAAARPAAMPVRTPPPPPPPPPEVASPAAAQREGLLAALRSAAPAQIPGILAQLCELDARDRRLTDARIECGRLVRDYPHSAEAPRGRRVLEGLPRSQKP